MKKLLHERLREAAKNGVSSIETCDRNIVVSLLKDEELSLADEIEKYYIPRPRFDDGEPVQFGDEVELHYKSGGCEKGRIQAWHVNKGPVWTLSFVGVDHERLYRYDSEVDVLKRPEPKALDADGAPCKKGETVFKLSDSTKWEVIDIHPTEPRIAVRQLDTEKEVVGGWFLAEEYSHREPDSLKKAVDDLGELLNFPMCDDIKLDKVEEVYNRLTAIMERDA